MEEDFGILKFIVTENSDLPKEESYGNPSALIVVASVFSSTVEYPRRRIFTTFRRVAY